MNVVLFGATGMVGSRILNELISRGHHVTAVARDPGKAVASPLVQALQGDVLNSTDVARLAKGADAVVSAYSPGMEEPEKLNDAVKSLLTGLKQAGVKRLLMVGGAAGLEAAPGLRLIDTPNFPAEWKGIAQAHIHAYEILKTADLDWTYFNPAALIQPGQRTDKFRLGKDVIVVDEKGTSSISTQDYAIAMVDEVEHPQHIRQRFTIGY